jgi:hypothetical protein
MFKTSLHNRFWLLALLRTLGVPIHKSHGDIVVPNSARPAVEALADRLALGRK